MIITLVLLLIIFLTIISCFVFYKYLTKRNYDLHGYELIFFELSFIFFFHTGQYLNINFYQDYIALYFLALLGFYYIIKTIKTKNKTSFKIILMYIIVSIANILSLSFLVSIFYYLVFVFAYPFFIISIILFILFMNLICIILENKKKDQVVETFKDKKILVMIVIVTILPLTYGLVGKNLYLRKEKNREEKAKNVVINYLNDKYGDANFKVVDINNKNICYKCFAFDKIDGYEVTLTSDYSQEKFVITITKDELKIRDDNFIFKYLSYLTNENMNTYDDIELYFKNRFIEKINKDYLNELDAQLSDLELNFNQKKFDKFFQKSFTLDDMDQFFDIDLFVIKINRIFTISEQKEFGTYIVDIYHKITNIVREDINNITFEFNYDNPFNSSYGKKFHITEDGDRYLIHIDYIPIIVEK